MGRVLWDLEVVLVELLDVGRLSAPGVSRELG